MRIRKPKQYDPESLFSNNFYVNYLGENMKTRKIYLRIENNQVEKHSYWRALIGISYFCIYTENTSMEQLPSFADTRTYWAFKFRECCFNLPFL